MRFRAPIGVYQEEKENKNDITVDLEVKADLLSAGHSDDLTDTIDYSTLYNIVRDIVMKGADLLEFVGNSIGEEILEKYPVIQKVKVTVHKNNPPIAGECRRTSVRMKFNR